MSRWGVGLGVGGQIGLGFELLVMVNSSSVRQTLHSIWPWASQLNWAPSTQFEGWIISCNRVNWHPP